MDRTRIKSQLLFVSRTILCVLLQIVDMCLTTIPATHKDKTLGLYNHWCKIFPDNKTLVCRSVAILRYNIANVLMGYRFYSTL